MRFALLALVGLLLVAGDASAFGFRRGRVQQVVVGHHAQAVVVHPQRVVVQQQVIHGHQQFVQPVVVQQQFHHAQPVIVSPARVFFAR